MLFSFRVSWHTSLFTKLSVDDGFNTDDLGGDIAVVLLSGDVSILPSGDHNMPI